MTTNTFKIILYFKRNISLKNNVAFNIYVEK